MGSSHCSNYYEIFGILTYLSGNERADSSAKAALQKDVSDCLISYTDDYQYISQYVHDLWQSEWDTAVNYKFHTKKPLIGEQLSAYRSIRRDEVVLSRLKLGQSYPTHSYLFKRSQQNHLIYQKSWIVQHFVIHL